jgi:hypothetical protein
MTAETLKKANELTAEKNKLEQLLSEISSYKKEDQYPLKVCLKSLYYDAEPIFIPESIMAFGTDKFIELIKSRIAERIKEMETLIDQL